MARSLNSSSKHPPVGRLFDFIFYLILAGSALIFCVRNPQYSTGAVNDDAVYILGARSLWATAAAPSFVMRPDYPMPGLPLVLAPFVRLVEPHWTSLDWLFVLATIGSVILFRKWAVQWLSPGEAKMAVALYAFNPVIAKFSGMVMPSILYTSAAMTSVLLMGRLLANPTKHVALALGFILGWAGLARPEGILLSVSVMGVLAFTRSGRTVLWAVFLPLACWIFFFFGWWRGRQGPVSEYGGDLVALLSFWSHHFFAAAQFAGEWLREMFIYPLTAVTFSTSWISFCGMGALAAFCLGVITFGFHRLWSARADQRPVLLSLGIFCGLFLSVHLFWHVAVRRYAIPVLPFLLIFLVRGMGGLFIRRRHPAWWTGTIFVLLLGSYAYRHRIAIHESLVDPNPMNAPPWRSLKWLSEHTPPDTVVLSGIAPSIELYANRPSVGEIQAINIEMFLDQLGMKKVKYVVDRQSSVFLASGLPGTSDPNVFWRLMRWRFSQYPERFQLVFSDFDERTTIYQVNCEPRFTEAYEKFRLAYQQYQAGRLDQAFRFVDDSLRLYPRLGVASNLLGALYWRAGQTDLAERAFSDTILYMPGSSHAMLNLATLYRQQGKMDRSHEYLQRAMQLARGKGNLELISFRIEEVKRLWDQNRGMIFMDAP